MRPYTMVDNSQEYRLKYWATRSSVRSLLALLTRSLAPDCSLRSRPPLRSLVRSLAHFAHSLARGTVNDWMAILSVFFSIFDHSASVEEMISICYHFRTMNINTILIDF